MNKLSELFKVLSDDTRLRIINLLAKQDLCVCELVDILELSQPKISKHIARLRSINLVTTKRNEQYIYYSLDRRNLEYMNIINTVLQTNNNDLLEDIKNLEKVETFVCSK
jgi:ArsR family transcriptional regulator